MEQGAERLGRRKENSMNIRMNALSILFAGAVLIMAGPATGTLGAAAVSRDPSTISDQVRHKLMSLPWYGVFDNLAYQINGSEVVLSGHVTSEHGVTKEDAGNAVKSIKGVTKVVNNIDVLPPSPVDNQIRRAEYRRIFSTSNLGYYSMGAIPQIHIIVENGHVTLEGQVTDQRDRNLAGLVANSVPGVFSVTNNLTVAKS
jgi:hyperosmotically inducible protein